MSVQLTKIGFIENAIHKNWPLRLLFALLILSSGMIALLLITGYFDRAIRADLVDLTEVAAASVDYDDVLELKGGPADLQTDSYRHLKSAMTLIHKRVSKSRFAYLVGKKDGNLVILVDSEAPTFPDYSAPGDIYYEAPNALKEKMASGESFTVGPYSDRWGRWISAYAPVVDTDSGEILAYLGIDISEEHWQKEIVFQQFLVVLTTALALALLLASYVFNDRRRALEQSKTEFVSIVSHQLRTPATAIRWLSEVLLEDHEGTLTPLQKQQLGQILEGNQRMIALVTDLLNISRIEAGEGLRMTKTDGDLLSIIDPLFEELAPLAKDRNIQLLKAQDFPSHLPASFDVVRMKQVFQNLIENGLKYSNPGTFVRLACDQSKPSVYVFSVQDIGIGIPLEQQASIARKFFRASNARTISNNGTGLGLYIAKTIVEQHGGKLWFVSEPGKGTTFFFSLPKSS